MKRSLLTLIQLIFFFNLFSLAGFGQDNTIQDTSKMVVVAIPVTDIILRATEVNTQLREKRTYLITEQEKEEIISRIDTLTFRLALLREGSRVQQIDALNLRSLESLESEWSFLDKLFDTEQEILNETLQEKENQRAVIAKSLSIWELTSKRIDEESAAELVIEQIEFTLKDIRETLSAFESDSKFIQEELVEISNGVIFTNRVIESIVSAKLILTRSLLSFDGPPIWKEFNKQKDSTIVFENKRSMIDDTVASLRDFRGQYAPWIWFHLVISILLIILIFVIYSNLRHGIPESDTPEITAVKKITERPLISGVLISVVLTFIIYNNVPDSVVLLTALLLLVPVYVILRAVIIGPARKFIILPLLAIIMVELHGIGYSDTLFSRLWLIVILLFSLTSMGLIAGKKSKRILIFSGTYGKLLMFAGFLAFSILIISLFANIFGAITLAEFLTNSVIESIVISMFIFSLVATLNSIITTSIHGNYLKKSKLFSENIDRIHKRLKSIINLIAIYLLINFTLRIFNVWNPVSNLVKGIFTYPITIGSMEFTLWNIFLFFFIIWLTMRISHLIRAILEGESGLRDRMRKGVPGALSLLLRISVFTIGFLVAIAAAGVRMDKLGILLGAFGVGIGFGLQNIFNNLVSGIILAFERPIKEGDIIEVGSLLGIVKEIGIRSSVIRTYEGSEVILPNGNLISNELINWTRTDMRRRGVVSIGVAYGTDPQRVIDLLLEVVNNYDRALKQPIPMAIFDGFGESSLDFRLLFWIGDADLRLVIQSEMAVLVNQAIVDAGITIPFPQRDLHVKSLDPMIAERIRAQDDIAKKQIGFKGPEKDKK